MGVAMIKQFKLTEKWNWLVYCCLLIEEPSHAFRFHMQRGIMFVGLFRIEGRAMCEFVEFFCDLQQVFVS